MELKITTKRALEFEERTGKDLVELLQQINKTGKFKVRDILDIFVACGEGYDTDKFDSWDVPLYDKVKEIMKAVEKYFGTEKAPKSK